MKEMTLRSRLAILIVATLLSIAGTFGTSALLAAQEAQANVPITQNGPLNCVKVTTTTYPYYVIKCYR